MLDKGNSEMLRGFCDRRTDGQTFAIVESLSRLKRTKAVVALRIMKKLGGG